MDGVSTWPAIHTPREPSLLECSCEYRVARWAWICASCFTCMFDFTIALKSLLYLYSTGTLRLIHPLKYPRRLLAQPGIFGMSTRPQVCTHTTASHSLSIVFMIINYTTLRPLEFYFSITTNWTCSVPRCPRHDLHRFRFSHDLPPSLWIREHRLQPAPGLIRHPVVHSNFRCLSIHRPIWLWWGRLLYHQTHTRIVSLVLLPYRTQ